MIWAFVGPAMVIVVVSISVTCIGARIMDFLYMSQAMRNCVLCHMRTTKAQISLRIRAVSSAPLLFAAKTE